VLFGRNKLSPDEVAFLVDRGLIGYIEARSVLAEQYKVFKKVRRSDLDEAIENVGANYLRQPQPQPREEEDEPDESEE